MIIINSNKSVNYSDKIEVEEIMDKMAKEKGIDKNIYLAAAREFNTSDANYITKTTLKMLDKNNINIMIFGYIYGEEMRKDINNGNFFGENKIGFSSMRAYETSSLGRMITDDGITDYAEYIEEYNLIVIHHDVFIKASCKENVEYIFKLIEEVKIIKNMSEEEYKKLQLNKKIKKIAKVFEKINEREIKMLKSEEEEVRYSIKTYMNNLKREANRQREILQKIDMLENISLEDKEKIEKEIKNTMKLPKVKDINSRDFYIIITTDLLYGKTEHGRMFCLAPYDIKIDFVRGQVLISCPIEYRRRSCWSLHDMHPHVGGHQEACWGNVASTVSQLLNEGELQALTTIVINYLENINVEDVAGKYCTNWDEVDPETLEVVHEGLVDKSNTYYFEDDRHGIECAICGEVYDDEEDMYYCDNCGHYMCPDCAIYIESIDQYVCEECEDLVQCSVCGRYEVEENTVQCEECEDFICQSCAESEDYNIGDHTFCSDYCMEEWREENEEGDEE